MLDKDICLIAKYRRFVERNEAINIGVIVFDNVAKKWYTKYIDEIGIEDKCAFMAWKKEWQYSINNSVYPTSAGLKHAVCNSNAHFFLEACPDHFVRKVRYLTASSHNDFVGVLYKSLVEPIRSVLDSDVDFDVLVCDRVDGEDTDC